ncbi:MAG: sigma-70 family RNA polymerase sigma factor [Granulosicoccus sp.]|nr:sigma-70 family RNA polymerase sigma factor [Granulosicoccus sp.]
MDKTSTMTDDDLIGLYLSNRQDETFAALVGRHHRRLYARFVSESKNSADASEMEQQLWLRVFQNLENYKHEGKFTEYLSRIASNLLNDYWRSKGRRSDMFVESRNSDEDLSERLLEQSQSIAGNHADDGSNQDNNLHNAELVDYLVTVLIPQLPVEQRMVWLLRHESEYWEPAQRLEWRHLGELNGIDEDEAWSRFEAARNKLMSKSPQKLKSDSSAEGPNQEETLIFTVWSQAQRLRKEDQFTWEYFANLLNVPTNTMKTRYRAAQKFLSEGLKAQMCS